MSTDARLCGSCDTHPVHDTVKVCARCLDRLERNLGDVAATADGLARQLPADWFQDVQVGRDGDKVRTVRQLRPGLHGSRRSQPWESVSGVRRLDLVEELAATGDRRSVTRGDHAGQRVADPEESSLPFVEVARAAAVDLHRTLARWAATFGHQSPDMAPTRSLAAWLLSRVSEVRLHEDAPELIEDVHQVVRRGTLIVDRPADRWYVGPCNAEVKTDDETTVFYCHRDLYVRPGASVVRCPACGAEDQVAHRRAWLLDHVRDHVDTAANIARHLTALGLETKAPRVRQWVKRRHLVAISERPNADPTKPGRPLYRLGDAEVLWARASAAEAVASVPRLPRSTDRQETSA